MERTQKTLIRSFEYTGNHSPQNGSSQELVCEVVVIAEPAFGEFRVRLAGIELNFHDVCVLSTADIL